MASQVPEYIAQRIGTLNSISPADQVALTNLLNALVDGILAVTTILDGDAGVTATNTGTTFTGKFAK
jgi:hypothetical protein